MRALKVVAIGHAGESNEAPFEPDDEWVVKRLEPDQRDESIVIIELIKDGNVPKTVVWRCHAAPVRPDSPYVGIADAYSVTLLELAGAIGLDRLVDKRFVDLWPGMDVHETVI